MTTIRVNERTKAGKALIQAARIMAEKHEGIEISDDTAENDVSLLKKMLAARQSGVVGQQSVLDTLNGIIQQ